MRILTVIMRNIAISLMVLLFNTKPGSPATVRLVSPLNNGVGRVEVLHNGVWGTVCDDRFSDKAAKVVCKQLGRYHSGFQPEMISTFGFGTGKIWLDDINCFGNETRLEDCTHSSWGNHNCQHSEDVGVICDSQSVTVKLTPSYKSGLLQVRHNNVWGIVCNDLFEKVEATVVCRMLGYDSGDVTDRNSSMKMWLDDVDCTMNNTDVKDCKHREWGVHNCGSSEAVGVSCYSFVEGATAARLKPVGNNNKTAEGILELYFRNTWGRVCNTDFRAEECAVACRMLGFNRGGVLIGTSYGSKVLVEDVHCKGTELDINNCTHSKWLSSNCTRSVYLKCHAAEDFENGVRLVSTVKGAGRVEVYYNNVWGTVCGSPFTYREARVVCRMAGLPWSGAYVDSVSSPGQGVIWLSNVQCEGGETTLERCNSSSLGETSCSHTQDVSVTCMQARLSNGGSETQGRLEVFYDNQWGTVCADGFNNMSAKVACEMLGHPGKHAHFVPRSRFGQGSGRVWLTNVQCRGTERSIGECPNSGWQGTACSHSKDVGVVCSYPPKVHLEGVNNPIILGMGLTVKCLVDDAYPPVTAITWSHNGQTTTGSTFHIRKISKTDRGPLTCSAVNGVGMSPGRAKIDITVNYFPEVHLEPRLDRINVNVGNNLTITCVVDDAEPNVRTLTWILKNRRVSGATFHLNDASLSDEGRLTCEAENNVGVGRAEIFISVSGSKGNETIVKTKPMTSQTVQLLSAALGVTGTVLVCLIVTIVVLCRKIKTVEASKERQTVAAASNPIYTVGNENGTGSYDEVIVRAQRDPENPYANLQTMPENTKNHENIYVNTAAVCS